MQDYHDSIQGTLYLRVSVLVPYYARTKLGLPWASIKHQYTTFYRRLYERTKFQQASPYARHYDCIVYARTYTCSSVRCTHVFYQGYILYHAWNKKDNDDTNYDDARCTN